MDSCFFISFFYSKIGAVFSSVLSTTFLCSIFILDENIQTIEAEHVRGGMSQIIQADSGRSVLRFSFIKGTGVRPQGVECGKKRVSQRFSLHPQKSQPGPASQRPLADGGSHGNVNEIVTASRPHQ